MILLIDNYDSFSYNLFQLVGELEPDIKVVRNDGISAKEVQKLSPSHIIISPGPGRPENTGVVLDLAKENFFGIPTLGVCLGHEAITIAYGGKVGYAKKLMHGKQSPVTISDSPIFAGLDKVIPAARYHSLATEEKSLPSCLKIIGRSDDGEIMALQHEKFPIFGVQFHPESVMTPDGKRILKNFIGIKKEDI